MPQRVSILHHFDSNQKTEGMQLINCDLSVDKMLSLYTFVLETQLVMSHGEPCLPSLRSDGA